MIKLLIILMLSIVAFFDLRIIGVTFILSGFFILLTEYRINVESH